MGIVDDLIQHPLSFSIAPAGCGKTEAIVEFIQATLPLGKALVLTHTNAGVHSIRKRAWKKGVNSKLFELQTIDSFCHKWVHAYPQLSEYELRDEGKHDPSQIRTALLQLLNNSEVIVELFRERWSGVIVDEYQDCTTDQHAVIMKLSTLMPCRILGDPLQGIFDFGKGNGLVDWDNEIAPHFKQVAFPEIPIRWSKGSVEMGTWLLDKRREIITEGRISLTNVPSSVHVVVTEDFAEPVKAANQNLWNFPTESHLVIHHQEDQCHKFAKRTGAKYHSLEELEFGRFIEFANKMETCNCDQIFSLLCGLLDDTVIGFTSKQKDIIERLVKGKTSEDQVYLASKLEFDTIARLCTDCPRENIFELFEAMRKLATIKVYRRETLLLAYWSLKKWSDDPTKLFSEIASSEVQRYRHMGRTDDARIVSRTLLVKGLDYDHSVIVDFQKFVKNPRGAYVALTRSKKTLTILTSSEVITFDKFDIPAVLKIKSL